MQKLILPILLLLAFTLGYMLAKLSYIADDRFLPTVALMVILFAYVLFLTHKLIKSK